MALHFLRCTLCGATYERNIPVSQGARAYCADPYTNFCAAFQSHTHALCRGTLEPVPGIGRMSVFSDADPRHGTSDFSKFTTQVEDPASPSGYRDVTIGSLSDIRRLERESEQAERNGEGRRMVWRDYAQDASNADRHTLGEDPSLKPSKTFTNGTPVLARRGDPVTADHGTIEE